ncbi:biorientation of chromosomes in cell division protein 1-like 1 isoform X2 [Halyomorpha halys]|uniref:biorientation of chromosomes in cell division protein 1-like 1 isoform X2 n=1 Tax=Halyomorpha halys TaxID=286706 RepID=UPI0006D4D767|nr:biorientation of chromosomes in cell division protein 1-like 1 isoform X2 [Halyomorpha halys]
MSFETFPQYPPVDGELVDRIVCKLKSQGIFDQFRKDCLADVDTKPAYQNLQQRVNGTVATFLATQTWQQDLNKTQLRESLRRHVQQGFLEVGVDRIVDQVVNPKVFTVFMPKVEDVVYDCLGIEKPKHPPPSNNILSGRKLTLLDLLPKDLDPVSPDSDNLSFDEEETKDETNNNESSSKLDISHDSQVSGISDLSSHMGDSFKENEENHIDSDTVKSVTSVKENSTEPHFENFENLSEKIKQAEIGGHNSATSPLPEELDDTESKATLEVEQNLQKDNRYDTLMEIDSVSNSTFEDAKTFTNKIIKEDTCSRTISEDSLSCSSFNAKFKKDKSKSVVVGTGENSMDKSEVGTPSKELSSDKEIKISSINEEVDVKAEEKVLENKETRKTDELKDKKHRESCSSKNSKSSSRLSDSKHRSDKKDDTKQSKEKTYKEDKERDKTNKDDKDRSNKHKDDRHHSSKDKYKDKDKNDRSRDKDSDKKKDKIDYKDSSEKDKKNDKDKYKERDKNDKEKTRNDKENHKSEKEKTRSDKDKDRHERDKDKYDKDKHEKNKRDKEKEKREKDKYESKEKDRDYNEKDKDKSEKDRSKERDRGKSERDYKNEKDKEGRSVDEKTRDDKRKDSKKYDKASNSSTKKDDNKSETKDKSKRSDESGKEKTPNSKSGKNEEEKRERKRKSERCNDEIKLKEARRSWDRDSSGGNGKGHGPQKSSSSECKVSSSSTSTKEKRTGESSNHQKANERKLEPVTEAEEPSDVDKILMKINSSIEESQNQNIQSSEEQAIKKPKIARNIFEIRKIMQARKNIARQAFKQQDKKRKEIMDSVEEADVTDSPSTTTPQRDNPKIREENKENIKAGQMDKLKNPKVGPIKGKFSGFLESDIEQSRNSLHIFRAHYSNFCTNMGMEVLPNENIDRIDFTKICDFSDDLLDDNLNKLKPKPVSLERRKTYPDDNQVSKAVENIMSGKNGCYVLLQDCNEVVEAMRNSIQPPLNKSPNKLISSNPQQNSAIDGNSNRTSSVKNLPVVDHISKKENLSSTVMAVPQFLDCDVDVGTGIISHTSPEQLKQGNSAKKSAIRTPAAKQQVTQDDKDEEAFSPVADVTIALNTYLNDSKEILPSVPLTEAMLDNLMQQSSILVEDETFTDSDDSIHGYEDVKKTEINKESGFEKEQSSLGTSGDATDESDGIIIPSDDPRSKRIANVVNSSSCDIFSRNKDSTEESSEIKVIKRRNQSIFGRCFYERTV